MTTRILQLTNIESQNILTNVTKYNLSEQLRTTVLLLERKWSAKNITPILDFDEFDVVANEDLLKQVWINLLDNAIKFSSNDAEIVIDLKVEGKSLVVKVSNFGYKIEEDELGRIFQKFYRTEKSHYKEGNGIGLYIAKHIIDLHKGRIEVESNDNKTTFLVSLPL